MSTAQSLNEMYGKWKKEAEGPARDELQRQLVKLLEKLALAICWKKIPDLRGEFSWVANEAIWRAVSGESRFNDKCQFSVWYYRIVINECNRLLKRNRRAKERTVPLESADVEDLHDPNRTNLGLTETIRALGWNEKLLVRLKEEGFSTREIARELGITEAAVKMRWSRLRGRLRDGIEQ